MDFWRAGFPWSAVNGCINNDTFDFDPPNKAKALWSQKTGLSWESLADSSDPEVACTRCKKPMTLAWTDFTCKEMWERSVVVGELVGESRARGYTDKKMLAQCQDCREMVGHNELKLNKFKNDIHAMKFYGILMPGTVLSIEGMYSFVFNDGNGLK